MLSDKQKDALKRVLKVELEKPEYSGKTPEQIHSILTTPTSTQGEAITRTKPMTDLDLLSLLGTETITKLASWVNFPEFRNRIKAQDFDGVDFWRQMMQSAGLLSAKESSALKDRLSEKTTEPGATVVNPPPIHNLLSGANLRAVIGEELNSLKYSELKKIEVKVGDKTEQRWTEFPLTMPNTIDVDDVAEVIASL